MLDTRIVKALEQIHESTKKLMSRYWSQETIRQTLEKKCRRVLKLMEPTDKRWN